MVRLYISLEGTENIWNDLKEAIKKASEGVDLVNGV
jgi:cystathionine beta-lyase/cystathionine gamma-synthase